MGGSDEKPIIVIGADSAVGSQLSQVYEAAGRVVWKTTRRRSRVGIRTCFLDLLEDVRRWPLPTKGIGTAFLCTSVAPEERCRLEVEQTRRVNVFGIVAVAKRLLEAGVYVIFLSTNLVFDGETPSPEPTDPVNPKTEQGREKAEAEAQIRKLSDGVAIVRFSKIISPGMPLFHGWMRDLQAGSVIHPFSDKVVAPISLAFAITVLRTVSASQMTGIIQASAARDITYAMAAQFIARKAGADEKLIAPISYREAGITVSPKHTTLDSTMLAEFGIWPPRPMDAIDTLMLQAAR